jgi:hypothetical protein
LLSGANKGMGDMETIYKEAVLLSDMAEVLKESMN